jgi:hypothetical protein
MPEDSSSGAINETMVENLFATSATHDTTAPDVNWQPIQDSPAAGQPLDAPAPAEASDNASETPTPVDSSDIIQPNPSLPRLRATTDGKPTASSGEVPARNAGYKAPESHATIIPGSGQPTPIPPADVVVPATGPDIESKAYPGFPGVPAPNASGLEPRSAQPQSTDVVR